MVEEGVYRGAYPTERNFRFLKRLKLRTLVSLTPQTPSNELLKFCERENVRVLYFPASKFKGDVTLPSYLVAEILEVLIDSTNYPLYLHCLDGGNNTGIVVACLRKLQNWALPVVHAEFSRFVRPKNGVITSSEMEFIESFHSEVKVPRSVPTWLWGGLRNVKHPAIRLKFVEGESGSPPGKEKDDKDKGDSPSKDDKKATKADGASLGLRALNIELPSGTQLKIEREGSFSSSDSTTNLSRHERK